MLGKLLERGMAAEHLQRTEISQRKAEGFKQRTEAIDDAIRTEYNKKLAKISGEPQTAPITGKVAQRVKSLTYEVTCSGETLTMKMGRDTELYLRPDLSNTDLEHMNVLTGPPLAGLGRSSATGSTATAAGGTSDPSIAATGAATAAGSSDTTYLVSKS